MRQRLWRSDCGFFASSLAGDVHVHRVARRFKTGDNAVFNVPQAVDAHEVVERAVGGGNRDEGIVKRMFDVNGGVFVRRLFSDVLVCGRYPVRQNPRGGVAVQMVNIDLLLRKAGEVPADEGGIFIPYCPASRATLSSASLSGSGLTTV